MSLIDNEIEKIIKGTEKFFRYPVSNEMAFNYLTLWYFYLCNEVKYKYDEVNLETVKAIPHKDCVRITQ